MSPIIFERLHPDVPLPTRATEQSAGYDLAACLLDAGRITVYTPDNTPAEAWVCTSGDTTLVGILPNHRALIPLGFKAQLPPGVEAQIRPRSGMSLKKGLTIPNAPGTIDSDYPDEWAVLVHNTSADTVWISHGTRIAQMVLARYETLPFVEGTVLPTTDRIGGFGSTGTA